MKSAPLPQRREPVPRARARVATPPPLPLPPVDMSLLGDLPSVELRARCMVEGFLNGHHRSPQKGSSVEFAEYRAYHPGDDLRRVDWRLFARNDRLHIKQYEDDTRLRVFVVIDSSASMNYSSRPELLLKMDFARLVAAGLATLARRQGDAFGLGIAGTDLDGFLPARSSQPHWKSFIGRLNALVPSTRASLAGALDDLASLLPPRSLVVIASDFYEESDKLSAALRRLRYDRHDLIGAHIIDPVEQDFDLDGSGIFFDAESPAWQVSLDPEAVREGYLARFRAFCSDLDGRFRAAGGEVVQLRTDRPPFEVLSRYLAQREQRT